MCQVYVVIKEISNLEALFSQKMPVNTRELIEAISIVADNHNIRVAIISILKASCTTAATPFAGGMVN